jgi:hypothetical protein
MKLFLQQIRKELGKWPSGSFREAEPQEEKPHIAVHLSARPRLELLCGPVDSQEETLANSHRIAKYFWTIHS